MRENQDVLLDDANQRFTSGENCNTCQHSVSKRESCGHIIERCHHPRLKLDADDGWPEVDAGSVCDWCEVSEHCRRPAAVPCTPPF